jgi:hypothetical protein
MTNVQYEAEGGFHDELLDVRRIGQAITALESKVYARLHTTREREAINDVKSALETLRSNIVRTRSEAA